MRVAIIFHGCGNRSIIRIPKSLKVEVLRAWVGRAAHLFFVGYSEPEFKIEFLSGKTPGCKEMFSPQFYETALAMIANSIINEDNA